MLLWDQTYPAQRSIEHVIICGTDRKARNMQADAGLSVGSGDALDKGVLVSIGDRRGAEGCAIRNGARLWVERRSGEINSIVHREARLDLVAFKRPIIDGCSKDD